MKFIVNTNQGLLGLGRILSYRFMGGNNDGEYSFARAVGENAYPRFHIYVKQGNEMLIFNLHLDQKKPSYEGYTAHSGEYEGEMIEREAERVKQLLASSF